MHVDYSSNRLIRTFRRFAGALVLSSFVATCGSASAQSDDLTAAGDAIDFSHQIVPILRKHCVECHGGREAKGGFSMNTRELVVNSGHVEVGKPDESYWIELIESDDPDLQMPPSDKPRVSDAERQLIRRWLAADVVWDDGFSFAETSYEPPLRPRRPELPPAIEGRDSPIDRVVGGYLDRQGAAFPGAIDDAAFLRRVSLDLVGLLPDVKTLEAFVADSSPDKRARMIDQLLTDDIAYADHWLTFFNDLLRNDYSGTGFITGGRAQITTWLYDSLRKNKPFDVLARELIAPPTAESRGYIDGIRWRGEVSAGQTVEIQFSQSISQSFLGINMKCASCHDSFIDRWKLDEAFGLAAIYAERPMEIHRCDKPVGRQAVAGWLFPEIGQVDATAPRDERLKQLADLMTHEDNGRFTRTIVNRLWYKLMGRGIVHPLDAMQSEPWDADLLDYLAISLSDHQYDLKASLREIANSRIYQSASVVQENEPTGEYVFRGPTARRMTAEQFLDGVWQITAAGPRKIDASVFRGLKSELPTDGLKLTGQWIWGDSALPGNQPPAGESLTMRKRFEVAGEVLRGGVVVTCDNGFVLYLNGRELLRGDDWTRPQAINLDGMLKSGENEFVVVATNAGDSPNPAALYLETRLMFDGGGESVIASDSTWEVSGTVATADRGRIVTIDGPWKPAVVVPPLSAWTTAIGDSGPSLLAQALAGKVPMPRASLMKNDFLMKSLGRPLRDQIVSMRPEGLTTLEAIDLSNGETLATALSLGASRLAERDFSDPSDLARHVFRFALSREPLDDELKAVNDYLGAAPSPTEIEDFLWAVMMMPEFLWVR